MEKEYNSKQKLEELEAINNERTARINELEARYAEQKELHQRQSSELTDLKVAVGQISEQGKALDQAIFSVRGQMQANRTAIETARAEIEICSEQCAQAGRDILKTHLCFFRDKFWPGNYSIF